MTTERPYRNPMAVIALLVSLAPFLISLAMLGTLWGVGPAALVYWVAQVGSIFLVGLIVVDSGLVVVALARAEGRRDWRVLTTFLLLALSILCFALFLKQTQ